MGDEELGDALADAMREAAWNGECSQITVTVANAKGEERKVRIIVVPEETKGDFDDEAPTPKRKGDN
jgi:hypothetical protein